MSWYVQHRVTKTPSGLLTFYFNSTTSPLILCPWYPNESQLPSVIHSRYPCLIGIAIHPLLHLFKKVHGLSERLRGLFSHYGLLMCLCFVEPSAELIRLRASKGWKGMGRLAGIVCTVPKGDRK